MNARFPLLLCAVALACSLAVWAFSRWMEEPELNNLRGGVERETQGLPAAQEHAGKVRQTPEALKAVTGQPRNARGISAPPSQNPISPDDQRIISELVESGMTQEEAALHYKRVSEMARIERSTRPPMPGVRTNVDVKRFPLFEE